VYFLAQASLRADAQAVADQQHADHQLGINRGSADGAVEARQVLTQPGAVDKAVDAPQQVIGRDMILEPECVEQALLHHETLAHHGPIHLLRMPHQGITIRRRSRGLFQRNRHVPDGDERPLWTGTSDVPVSERISLPDPKTTFGAAALSQARFVLGYADGQLRADGLVPLP
jgi:hypothetical protein